MILPALIAFFPFLHSAQDVAECLPFSESAIERIAEASATQFQEGLDHLLAIPGEERTFDNTVRAWDRFNGAVQQALYCIGGLMQVYPEKNLRDSASSACQKLGQMRLEALAAHPEIYRACLDARQRSTDLSEEQLYYLDQLIGGFERIGMQLGDEERALFAKIGQEIVVLEGQFAQHVSEDRSALFVSKEELLGLEDDWIESREMQGVYRLEADFPTYKAVLSHCSVRKTRNAMYQLFVNRAFPQNEEVVAQLIAKRDQLAKLMGFPSFADYDLKAQMIGSPQRAEQFLKQMKQKVTAQVELEFKKVTEELPEGVLLNASGQLERYDELYVYTCYKKKHFSVDQNEIAEYFPMDKTIEGLIRIYEQFFGLSIREAPHSVQVPDLKALEVRDCSGELLGVILLDLFPREGKNAHVGICYSLIEPFSPPGGPDYPAACLLIGNFTKPSERRPSLMMHEELAVFFHEFGHAIHGILGRNELFFFCGMEVKGDFIELPSLLLEKWVWDPEILRLISSHYVTQEPLADEQIQNMIRADAFGKVTQIERSCFLSEFSLALFAEGEIKHPTELMHRVWGEQLPRSSPGENNHFHASWWHVPNYGPKYYSYLWAEVFAVDLFEKIRKEGLLNREVGAAYAKAILGKGGSRDPDQMLVDFLGREPSLEPFFKQLVWDSE